MRQEILLRNRRLFGLLQSGKQTKGELHGQSQQIFKSVRLSGGC